MVNGNKIVALCTSRIYDLLTHGFIEALNDILMREGCRLWIYAINADLYWDEDNLSPEISVFDYIPYDLLDFMVFMDERIKSKTVAKKVLSDAADHDIPVIVVDGNYGNTADVSFDYEKGFEAIVRHVIEDHGVKRPHFMGGIKGNKFSTEREVVFRKVAAENGIVCDESMISYGEFWAQPARVVAQKLIDSGNLPEAIICANDIMAINVCDVLKNAGIDIPGDVIVTGFDGYEETYLSSPGITTSDCDVTLMAQATGDAIKEYFRTGVVRKHYFVVPRFVPNESCGCPRCVEIANKMALNRFNSAFYRYQDDNRMIHDTIAGMMGADSLQGAVACLRGGYTQNVYCVVKKESLNSDRNFFLENIVNEGYCLVYYPGQEDGQVVPYDIKDPSPYLEKLMESGYPLAFQEIDYMGKTMGYVCYFIPSCDITEYSKTCNITNMISTGLGGYINMRCQSYLLDKVEKMYKFDALTGLYNRLAFHEAFEKLKEERGDEGLPLTVIMADLNRLKKINDTLGHEAGDKAIASVASALRCSCPDDALCVRFGGDELLSFIPGECDISEILGRISDRLKSDSKALGYEVSASCGAYATTLSGELNFEDAVKHADEEMYKEKLKTRRAAE